MNPVTNQTLTPIVENKPAYHLIGIQDRHNLTEGEPALSFAEQWTRFMQRIQEITGRDAAAPTLGVCFASPAGSPFEYFTGAVVSQDSSAEVPSGMSRLTLEPQTYAIFIHTGPIAKLGETYTAIHQWLGNNKQYIRAQAPEIEYYDHRYTSVEAPDSEFDIYIPVAKQ